MANDNDSTDENPRRAVAFGVLIFSAVAITALAITAIWVNHANALTIVNIFLPVIASWVGTVLAFYFGRENFESANRQVRALFDRRLSLEERASIPVTAVMKRPADIIRFEIPAGKKEGDIPLTELRSRCTGEATRLPVTDTTGRPRYMIHASSIDRYLVSGGKPEDSLEMFLVERAKEKQEFGPGKGFVLVPETATLDAAKRRLEAVPSCKDIFVTKGGSADEPLSGWISNVRMEKYLSA